nr:hypothetical protein [Streptomyces sp. NRRL F-5630]
MATGEVDEGVERGEYRGALSARRPPGNSTARRARPPGQAGRAWWTLPTATGTAPEPRQSRGHKRLMKRWSHTGEERGGSYFWCSDALIVGHPGIGNMTRALTELIDAGDLGRILLPLDDD